MVKADTVVTMTYRLSNSKGEELDRADANEPFPYLHGHGNIVPGLEKEITGMKPGEKKKVVVAPKEGYGETDPALRLSLDRSQFPKNAKLDAGMRFAARSDDGHQIVFTVIGVAGDKVEVDGNHPLAGETLHFDIEILNIRDATPEELEHGHVHTPGEAHH